MIEFRVEVSSEDIVEAKRYGRNPIVVSTKRLLPGAFSVGIDRIDCTQSLAGNEKEVSVLGYTFSLTFHLPKIALQFLDDFDFGKYVRPFEFVVSLGEKK